MPAASFSPKDRSLGPSCITISAGDSPSRWRGRDRSVRDGLRHKLSMDGLLLEIIFFFFSSLSVAAGAFRWYTRQKDITGKGDLAGLPSPTTYRGSTRHDAG